MPNLIVKKSYPYRGRMHRPGGELHRNVPARDAKLLVAMRKAAYADGSEALSHEIDASDAAREFAEREGIDITKVEGTGAHGRITKGDVQHYKTRMMTAETYQTTDMKAE